MHVSCNTYLLDSDLSSGQHYPAFEQPGPGHASKFQNHKLITIAACSLHVVFLGLIGFFLTTIYMP